MLTRNALGNLINRYKAVLGKCRLLNVFGSLAVAGMLVAGGAGIAAATEIDISADTNVSDVTQPDLKNDGAQFSADKTLTINEDATAAHVTTASDNTGSIVLNTSYTLTVTGDIGATGAAIKAITGEGSLNTGGNVTTNSLTLLGASNSIINGTLTLTDGVSSVKNLIKVGGLVNESASTLTIAAGDLVLSDSASFTNAGTLNVGVTGAKATLDLRGAANVTNAGTITVDGRSGSAPVPSDNLATLVITSSQLDALHAGSGQLNVGGGDGGFVAFYDETVTLNTGDLADTATGGKIALLADSILGTHNLVLNGTTLKIAESA
ncbi:MAG: hypothetical protein LBB60_05075, partial [Desulfovibrio sp.]|nr:hypothetical protein [Desulfovibrio sp.]